MARNTQHTTQPQLLTPEELARRWRGKVNAATLRNWRSLGRGPAFTKVEGGRVRYRLEDVLAFEGLHRFRKSPSPRSL